MLTEEHKTNQLLMMTPPVHDLIGQSQLMQLTRDLQFSNTKKTKRGWGVGGGGGGGGADYSPGKWTNHLHNLHIAGSSPVEDMHSGRDSVLDLGGGVGGWICCSS